MSDFNDRLRKAIQQLAGTYNKDGVSVFECTVDSVDSDAFTCDVTAIGGNATTKVPGVRLASESNDGIKVIPKVGSTVIVTLTDRGIAFVSMFSDIDEIVFFDGSLDGMVKVGALITKLNNLENKLNDLINSYVAHVHTATLAVSGSSATGSTNTTIVAPPIATLTPTQQNEIENTLIKQGI